MRKAATFVLICFIFGPSSLWADFSYTETTRVTGGTPLNVTRFMPGLGDIKEPATHAIAVKGGKMIQNKCSRKFGNQLSGYRMSCYRTNSPDFPHSRIPTISVQNVTV